jgi:hypothetical protein
MHTTHYKYEVQCPGIPLRGCLHAYFTRIMRHTHTRSPACQSSFPQDSTCPSFVACVFLFRDPLLWRTLSAGTFVFFSLSKFQEQHNLNLDGAPIASSSHTHPSHSQTSRLLTSSLSLGLAFLSIHNKQQLISC